MRWRMLVVAVVGVGLTLAGACRPAGERVDLSEAERELIDRLQRDARVEVVRIHRRVDDSLLVETRQGSERVTYQLTVEPAPGDRSIRRVVEGRLR